MNDEIKTTLAHPAVQAGEYPELPAAIDSYYDDIDKEVVTTYSASQMRAYADATCEARAAAASKPRGKEARERRRWLSDSFNRGTQTLDEATVSARAMALALATPAQAAALVSPSDDGFMAAVNEMDGLYAAPLAITSAPKRIWLDLGFNPYEDDVHFSHLHDVTWSQNNATGGGVEYVRADLAAGGAAQAAPVDAERLDYLQECGVTVEVLPGRPGWTFRIGGLHGTVHRSVRTAIDAARAAQGGCVMAEQNLADRAIEANHGIKATNQESNK